MRDIVKTLALVVVAAAILWNPAHAFDAVNDRLGLPAPQWLSEAPQDASKAALGRRLFFDKRLSADGTISCASCHQPERGFTDGLPLARGLKGRVGTRHVPTIVNAALLESQFWDGRRSTLEEQAREPFVNPAEHGLANEAQVVDMIADSSYRAAFVDAFGVAADSVSIAHVVRAIAAYERTLIAGNSPFDRYEYAGQNDAISTQARRGLELFRGRAQCVNCHIIGPRDALFTDHGFHSLGVGLKRIEPRLAELATRVANRPARRLDHETLGNPELAELGRFLVTLNPADIGRFKTPSLRNVALTAPYMHDGSVATLEDAVEREVYYRGIEMGRPLVLTPGEKAEMVEFLKTLTSPQFLRLAPP
jgi:cytochrome c peroxidase